VAVWLINTNPTVTGCPGAQPGDQVIDQSTGTVYIKTGTGSTAFTLATSSFGGGVAGPHTHDQSDVTGLTTALDGKAATSHTHAQADVTGLVSALSGKADSTHTHAQSDVTNLTTDLAAKESTANKNANSGYCGLDSSGLVPAARMGSGGADNTVFLRGDRTWAAPAGAITVREADATPEYTGVTILEADQAGGLTVTQPGASRAKLSVIFGVSSGTACAGNDSRLSDARTPTAHATSHRHGGGDEVATATPAANAIPKAESGGTLAIGWIPTGSSSSTVCIGNDSRLSDARTPTSHAASHQNGGSDEIATAAATANAIPKAGAGGTLAIGWIPTGSTSSTVCIGNDSRLSDARTPTAHATSHKSGGSDPIKLDELAAPTDITTLNASTTAHGLLPKLSGTTTTFLRGDGTWATPAGGSTDKDEQYYRHIGTTPFERWYIAGLANATAITTGAPSVNVLRAMPFLATRGGTLGKISIRVTAAVAGTGRLGIYQATSDTNLYPNTRILDAGTVDHGTTGVKTLTISQALTANTLYWLCHVGSSAATIHCLALAGAFPIFGIDTGFGTAPGVGVSVAFTFGVLPATFPTGGSVITATPIPAIAVQFSA